MRRVGRSTDVAQARSIGIGPTSPGDESQRRATIVHVRMSGSNAQTLKCEILGLRHTVTLEEMPEMLFHVQGRILPRSAATGLHHQKGTDGNTLEVRNPSLHDIVPNEKDAERVIDYYLGSVLLPARLAANQENSDAKQLSRQIGLRLPSSSNIRATTKESCESLRTASTL